jgi:NitT/TauT family transport system ATP-binding protein
VRAHGRAAAFIEDEANRDEVAVLLAAPDRIGVAPEVIRRTLDGRMKIAPDGTARVSDRYLLVGRKGAARPDPVQAAWLYTQMVRWGQAPLSAELLAAAKAVFRPDLYDAAIVGAEPAVSGEPADGIGAFAGPSFDPGAISIHLESWGIRRA